MSTARPAVGDLFNPGAQSLTGTFDPVYVTREAVARELERHASAVGRRRVDAALRWPVRRADVGWRQVGAARQLFLPAIHHAAAVHVGLWLLVCQSVLPELQCESRSHRRTRAVHARAASRSARRAGCRNHAPDSSAPPCFIYSPAQYAQVVHLTESTFLGGTVSGMTDDIRQPYASSWTVGIQRDLGGQRALEVRYNGNRTRQPVARAQYQ